MRNPQRKEETRRRMLEAAGRNFRSHGYAGIGVDGIAKAAGATSGAFYAHFGSKDGAFSAALDVGLDEVIEAIPKFQQEFEAEWVQAFVDYYLGKEHRKDLAGGCAMTTLSPEIARAETGVRAAYEVKMSKIFKLIADGLAGGTAEEREARAWAFISTLIGGLTLSRAVRSAELVEGIACGVGEAAVKIAGRGRGSG